MLVPYRNEPFTDFSATANQTAMAAALTDLEAELGGHVPLQIGEQSIMTKQTEVSLNPCDTDQVIARSASADAEHAELAVEQAWEAFASWSRLSFRARARYLQRAAAIMRRQRFRLNAALVLEVGKNWAEADADTAEAIDFLEYYARQAVRLGEDVPVVPYPGEENQSFYLPLGVGAVITPWNFPLAILTGMTAAAVVTGNTVVLKPAESTPFVASLFMAVMQAAGVPAGVINLLPGRGEVVGEYLVDHPRIRFVSFTGSREIGCRIYERAARVQPGQRWLRRVVAEMGGKNAVIVDSDADLQWAVQGIVAAAFGFQGQKCSAASRVIVVDPNYEAVLAATAQAAAALKVGPARAADTQVAAVADEAQYKKVLRYIEIGRQEARLVTGGKAAAGPTPGYYIEPTVFAEAPPTARIMQEEIFGPVVAFMRVPDFPSALAVANDTEYGLTGAVFSHNRAHLELARREFHVGNLYLNRKNTGALVGVQPFGGFDMSGTDAKAGGSDYLLYFVQMKSVTERL